VRVVWRATAREDRRRITAWLAERNPVAAVRVSRALLAAADSLASLPEKGRPGLVPGTRELSAVPPYVIVYQVDRTASVIRIVRVWHTAQDRGAN
jgi:toxin ParE1/3/4